MADERIAGRYRLLEPLGRGAMSAVWAAHDEELDRDVAVKMLAPSAERERFVREARAAAALSHPNIVALYDFGEFEGRPFMVLERLSDSLEDRLQSGDPLPELETRRIAVDVASGLAHAHERGLVHRDLKPANILFDSEGRAKIADFGIARMRGTGTLTDAGTVLGTASYISPEQAAGEPAGPASDVYSFGVVLFRMLTGKLPFTGTNAMEVARMHRDLQPPAVTDLRPDAPPALAALVASALAKDPARRPADGGSVLTQLQGDEGTTQVLPRVVRRPRRAPVAAAAIVAALLLAGGAALAVLLTTGGGGGGPGTVPTLSLPTVPTVATTSAESTAPATAPSTSTREVTTAPATTAATTTAVTEPRTTAPTTTAAPTTVLPPTTTLAPTATSPTTSETGPTTTADTTTTGP